MKKYLVIPLSLLTFALISLFFFGSPWPWKVLEAKHESTAYLEAKYNEQFDVKMPRFWIMDGNFHAEASPVEQPEIIFSVGTEQGEDGIQDNYVLNAWHYEGKKIIAESFSPFYDAKNIAVDIDMINMQSNDPQLNKEAATFTITIELEDEELTAVEQESRNIYKGLTALKANDFQVAHFNVYYKNGMLNLDYLELNGLGSVEELVDLMSRIAQ
ncbi:MAG: hypothetical protein ABS882_13125 [Lysinibacillus sp.]